MTRAHAGLYAGIAGAPTRWPTRPARGGGIGLTLHELAPWYDVDDRAALDRLLAELDQPGDGYASPRHRAVTSTSSAYAAGWQRDGGALRALAGAGALLLALVVAELFCHRPGELDLDRLGFPAGAVRRPRMRCRRAVFRARSGWCCACRLASWPAGGAGAGGADAGGAAGLAAIPVVGPVPLCLGRPGAGAGHQPLPLHPRRPGARSSCATRDLRHTNRSEEARTIYPPDRAGDLRRSRPGLVLA